MGQDWLQKVEEAVDRAQEVRDIGASTLSAKSQSSGALLVARRVLPNARRHNVALDAEVANICDAAVIAAAQAEAQFTRQREPFMLVDGNTGSVDADGNVYDERPPQG